MSVEIAAMPRKCETVAVCFGPEGLVEQQP
jgi:hypothetical protein